MFAFTTTPILHQNKPPRESIFLRPNGQLVRETGTHNVKIRA